MQISTYEGLKKPIVDRVKNDRPRMSKLGLMYLTHYIYIMYIYHNSGHLQSR